MSRVFNRTLTVGLMILLACAVSPAASKVDKLAQNCKEGKQKACAKLARIAKTGRDYNVRRAAIEKLSDQAVLADIAKTDRVSDARRTAVEKLTDQVLLAGIAKTGNSSLVREAAVRKLSDQAVLGDIAKNNRRYRARRAAVTKLSDKLLLADIAKSDSAWKVREAAVKKLTDCAVLADIGRTDSSWHVRLRAVEKLTDQAVLRDIARTEKDEDVREAAMKKLSDQPVPADVAKASSHRQGGIAAQNPEIKPGVQSDVPTVATGKDDHVTLSVKKIERGETLSAGTLEQMGLRADQLKQPPEGTDLVALCISFDKIKGVYLEMATPSSLYDDQGNEYRSGFNSVRGIQFLDSFTGPGWVVEGAVSVLLFQVPKDHRPARLSFSYHFKEGWDEFSGEEEEEWKNLQTKTGSIDIDLKQVHVASNR